MALTQDSSSLMMWTVYQNLAHDSANFTPTETETVNYADQLLHGLINNETFKEAVSSIATEIGRADVAAKIDDYARVNEWAGDQAAAEFGARGVMQEIANNNPEGLVNLAERPDTPILPLDNLQKFFDIQATIQEVEPELNTYIMADPRFIEFFDQYAAATEMSGEGLERLRAEIVAKHEEAVSRFEGATDSPDDDLEHYQGQMYDFNMSENLYELVETGNLDVLGYDASPEKNIFSGLELAAPVEAAVLAETAIPLASEVIQAAKDAAAAEVETVDGPGILPLDETIQEITREQAIVENNVVEELNAPPVIDTEEVVPEINVDEGSPLISSLSGVFVSSAQAATLTPEMRAAFRDANNVAVETTAVEPEPKTYTVESGDTLWAIAREEYGLTDYKDIMQAVDHIANDNGLANGADANHIEIGQVLNMPTAEEIQQPVQEPDQPLNWQTLDADVASKSQLALTN